MTTIQFIVLVILAIAFAILLLFPAASKLIKGFINVFIQDAAMTPDGARAIYDQKIDEIQEKYNRSATMYKKLVGELSQTEDEIETVNHLIKTSEQAAESAVREERMNDAALYAEERENALNDLEILNKKITELRQMTKRAEIAYQENEALLIRLKAEKKKIVRQITTDEELKQLYNELDENCQTSATDKLLDSVRDGAEELRKETVGAAHLYDAKFSTRKRNADISAQKSRTNDYLESLKVKYNKQ